MKQMSDIIKSIKLMIYAFCTRRHFWWLLPHSLLIKAEGGKENVIWKCPWHSFPFAFIYVIYLNFFESEWLFKQKIIQGLADQ